MISMMRRRLFSRQSESTHYPTKVTIGIHQVASDGLVTIYYYYDGHPKKYLGMRSVDTLALPVKIYCSGHYK